MRRRDFLGLGAALPLLSLCRPARAMSGAEGRWDRVLVLLDLQGGNDGLNTLIPYADPAYARTRPRLGIARDQVLQLSDDMGMHPSLQPLMKLWQAGELAWVQGVGYAQPNRSHFRSIEIWETGSDSGQVSQQGWLARALEGRRLPGDFVAGGIVVGNNLGPLGGGRLPVLTMNDPRRFVRRAQRVRPLADATSNPALRHLLSVRDEVAAASAGLERHLAHAPALSGRFPRTAIGRRLQVAAELLVTDTRVAVIKVAHGSFDTHSAQPGRHRRLLQELAEALVAFRSVLEPGGHWRRVLVMSYSEFGRRVAENGSQGTDHGTAAPHFLLGGALKGGLYGRQPSLTDLDAGDLKYHLDYRCLYQTVLSRWWRLPDARLDGRRFPIVPCVA
jgi:uncharacterized protein (DUF1501 family)